MILNFNGVSLKYHVLSGKAMLLQLYFKTYTCRIPEGGKPVKTGTHNNENMGAKKHV